MFKEMPIRQNENIHIQIYADRICFDLAESYAAVNDRGNVKSISDFMPEESKHSFLICSPQNLQRNLIESISTQHSGVIGVATARNLNDLANYLSRQPSANSASETLLLDELNDAQMINKQNIENYPKNIHTNDIVRPLRLLTLHAHGDGAHANLRSIVLCGQAPNSQLDTVGCDSKNCKRASRASGNFITYEKLSISEILFLSCNGFSVSGDLFPGNTSSLLSIVSSSQFRFGIFNDRTVPLSLDQANIAHHIARDYGIIFSYYFLKELSQPKFYGENPWLLIGDPAFMIKNTHSHNGLSRIEYNCTELNSFKKESNVCLHAYIDVEDVYVATKKTIFTKRNNSVTRTTINDLTFEVDLAISKINKAFSFVLELELCLESISDQSLDLDHNFRKLRIIRQTANKLLKLFNTWKRNELLTTKRGQKNPISIATDFIDAFPRLICESFSPLIEHHFEDLLADILVEKSYTNDQRCERCGSRMVTSKGVPFFDPKIDLNITSCPTCGKRSASIGKILERKFQVDKYIDKDAISIRGEVNVEKSWHFIILRDKATGNLTLKIGPIFKTDLFQQWYTDDPLNLDLHTLVILSVSESGLQIDRFRVARVTAR